MLTSLVGLNLLARCGRGLCRAVGLARPPSLADCRRMVGEVAAREPEFQAASDAELRRRTLSLRYRFRSGQRYALLPEAFALVREAARRCLGMRPYDEQVLAGIVMAHGGVAELATGEGKTLAMALPAYFFALAGKGVHVVTRHDHAAEHGAERMRPLFAHLGLRAGLVLTQHATAARREAYACDVTYGTAREMGFDFLRERLRLRRIALFGDDDADDPSAQVPEALPVMREPWAALLEGIDRLLLDFARTPLIIAGPSGEMDRQDRAFLRWSALHAPRFEEGTHYYGPDPSDPSVALTRKGRDLVRSLGKGESMGPIDFFRLFTYVERAIKVRLDYRRGTHYSVTDGKVVTLNQSTGEPEPGRRYTQGIHQAIEAEERLEITVETRPAARISVQAFFDQYRLLAGLSATATDSAGELRRECDLRVVPIAPRQQRLQTRLPGRLFASGKEKLAAIVEEAGSMHRQGRPVLIGVCSHASLSELPSLLSSAGIPHQLFHGDGSTQDWEIWAQAGNQGRVTICTDVAWESSIKLGPEVAALGGLHVIAGEPHESRRLDRELLDQCACGGDPGTFRQYGALDDPLLREKRGALRGWVDRLVDAGLLARLFHVFQRRLQRRDAAARRKLRSYDRRRQKWLAYLGLDPCLD